MNLADETAQAFITLAQEDPTFVFRAIAPEVTQQGEYFAQIQRADGQGTTAWKDTRETQRIGPLR